jgi:HD-like signal output (HDOD) protein
MFPAEHASSELGGLCLDLWNLPSPMIETAFFVDEPEKTSEENRAYVEAVGCADRVVHYVGNTGSIDGVERTIPAGRRTDASRVGSIARRALDDLRERAFG